MPRVAPVTGKSEVPAEHHAVVDDVLKVFGNVRGPFSMLLHSPKLAERVLPLVTFFRDESVVDAKLRSIAILSAVREREAAYVWSAQVGAARRNGLREEVIDLLRAKGDPAKLPAEERDIVTYVRQLMRTAGLGAAGFEGGESLPDVDGGAELALHPVDPGVDATDLRHQFPFHGVRLGPQGVDLRSEARVHAIDLLIQAMNVAPDDVQLRRYEILERRLDLVVDSHALHWINLFRHGHFPA